MALTATFIIDGVNATYTIEYSGNKIKLANFIIDALKQKYPKGLPDASDPPNYTPIDNLTNQQKADEIMSVLINYGKDLAKTYYRNDAVEDAKDTANTEIETRYE